MIINPLSLFLSNYADLQYPSIMFHVVHRTDHRSKQKPNTFGVVLYTVTVSTESFWHLSLSLLQQIQCILFFLV